jgi:hypothetical protein
LRIEVGEDFLAPFKGVEQHRIFHEEPEGLPDAGFVWGKTSLNDACSDDTGLHVDAADSAGGLACAPLQHLRRCVGGEAAKPKRQHEKHETEKSEVAGHRATRFILNLIHDFPSSLFR